MIESKETALPKSAIFPYRLVIPALAFCIPLFVSGPQLLTGSVVNCLLFLAASRYSKKDLALVAVAPSVGALMNGLLFGRFTPYLAYFLPIIWADNLILMRTYMSLKDKGFVARLIVPAALKTSFLYIFALLLFSLGIVPKIFLTAMGILQLGTGLIGGVSFLFINRYIYKYE